MSDSIEMNYYEPETTTWTVNLDGRYMSAVQNYLLADGIPWSYVKKKYKLNMPFLRLAYPARASAFSSNAA